MVWNQSLAVFPCLNVWSRLHQRCLFLESADEICYHAAYGVPPEIAGVIRRAFQSAALLRSDLSCRVRPDICGPSDWARHSDRCITACRVSGEGVWLLGTRSDECGNRWNHTEPCVYPLISGVRWARSSQHLCRTDGIFFAVFWNKRVFMMIFKAKEWMNEFDWICEVWLNLWLSYLRYNFRIFQQLKALIIINVFFFIKKFHKNISTFFF